MGRRATRWRRIARGERTATLRLRKGTRHQLERRWGGLDERTPLAHFTDSKEGHLEPIYYLGNVKKGTKARGAAPKRGGSTGKNLLRGSQPPQFRLWSKGQSLPEKSHQEAGSSLHD